MDGDKKPSQENYLPSYLRATLTTPRRTLAIKLSEFRDYIKENEVKEREQWEENEDFIFASLGSVVGLGNVLWFPYLCHKNGGGAFLIPYVCSVLILGIPLSVMEISIGQFTSFGCLKIWNIVPLLKGIGFASMMTGAIQMVIYNVILAWVLFYVWRSIDFELPWKTCDNWWNSFNCSMGHARFHKNNDSTSPVQEFWVNYALKMNNGDTLGSINVDLFLCYCSTWFIIMSCVSNGMKISGRLAHLTAVAPYVFMFVFTVYSFTLDGAFNGLRYYLTPDFSKLTGSQVWWDAAAQVFFSSSIASGILPTVGSFNKFYYKSGKATFQLAFMNSITSFLSGGIVFAMLGFASKQIGLEIKDVIKSGPGLIFQTYPKEVLNLPVSQAWAFMYFLMCFLLGLDTSFLVIASIITSFVDQFPKKLRKGHREKMLSYLFCFTLMICGIPMVCEGGIYIHTLGNSSLDRIVTLVAMCECLGIMYVYGGNRFFANFLSMNGSSFFLSKIIPFLKICLYVLDPLICLALTIVVDSTAKTFQREDRSIFFYPKWSLVLTSIVEKGLMSIIPLFGFILFFKQGPSLKTLKKLVKPKGLQQHQLLPGDEMQSWCQAEFELRDMHDNESKTITLSSYAHYSKSSHHSKFSPYSDTIHYSDTYSEYTQYSEDSHASVSTVSAF